MWVFSENKNMQPPTKKNSQRHEELPKTKKQANMTLSAPSLPHDDDHRDVAHMYSHLHVRHSQPHAPVSTPAPQFQHHDSNNNNNMYVPPGGDNDASTAFGFIDQQQQSVPTSVLRVSREVENIGARVPMSKKRISWRFVIAGFEQVHTVTLEHSRITAKKRLRLDGRRLFNSEQYCAGDWKYEFRVEEHAPRFTVVIKDVKTTVVDQHSLANIYQLHLDGYTWEQLPERVFAGAVKRRFTNPVWSSDKFARRVSDETFDLQHSNQQPGTGHAWVIAFGVLGTIHKFELWDLEEGEFVVVLDCRELARVKHDDIEEDSWEYEYTLANQHELVLTVTLEDEGKRYDFSIDGSPWRDISETEFVLQPGWFPVYSRSKGTAYFRNHATSETRWEKPIMSRNGSTIIEQIPSQDLKPTVSPVHKHEDPAVAAQYNSFSSNQLEFQPSPSSPPAPLVFQQEPEVNLLDFSEISVHSSPTHAQQQQQQSAIPTNYASFDPFDPMYQSTAQPPPPAQYQQQTQQFQQPIDLLF